MQDVLLTDRRDGYAILTLNRPASLNALSRELIDAIADSMKVLESDTAVRALILTGAGKAFCAGMDLKELKDPNGPLAQEGGLWAKDAINPVTCLSRFSGPIIAAVNGAAVTGGFEMALACDVIIASTTARFADTHARVGVIPGGGVSQYLSRSLGIHRAKELHLTGNFLSAQRAYEWGLLNRVVEPDQLLLTAEAMVREMLEVDDVMLKAYKKLVDQGFGLPFAEGVALEEQTARAMAGLSASKDIEARAAGVLARGRRKQ